eukprot:2136830-Alexandrium_andersonii.AAC.1
MFARGKLSAKAVCTLRHRATRGGIAGPAHELALGPESHSGHFQRKLDKAFDLKGDKDRYYRVRVPHYD